MVPSTSPLSLQLKALKICNILGGLDLTRLRLSEGCTLFQGAIEDVELIQKYMAKATANKGLRGGLPQLSNLAKTLDWKARDITMAHDTVSADLGYSDNQKD